MAEYTDEIAKLIERHGNVPPLWAMFPATHPCEIGWRMGGGEAYKHLFIEWWDTVDWDVSARLAYMKSWDPPYSWLEWVAWMVWESDYEDTDIEVKSEHFEQMEAAGLGSRADWTRTFEVDPEDYPVEGDTSSRWLAAPGRAGEF